jgi:hypothetical protein
MLYNHLSAMTESWANNKLKEQERGTKITPQIKANMQKKKKLNKKKEWTGIKHCQTKLESTTAHEQCKGRLPLLPACPSTHRVLPLSRPSC